MKDINLAKLTTAKATSALEEYVASIDVIETLAGFIYDRMADSVEIPLSDNAKSCGRKECESSDPVAVDVTIANFVDALARSNEYGGSLSVDGVCTSCFGECTVKLDLCASKVLSRRRLKVHGR